MIARMGRRFKHKKLEFWADRGLIHVIDTRKEPPEYKVDTLREFLYRAQNFIDERTRIQHKVRIGAGSSNTRVDNEAINELQTLIEDMVRCVEIAKQQGDPTDPRVQQHVMKHGAPGRRLVSGTGLGGGGGSREVNRPVPLQAMQPPASKPVILGADGQPYKDYAAK